MLSRMKAVNICLFLEVRTNNITYNKGCYPPGYQHKEDITFFAQITEFPQESNTPNHFSHCVCTWASIQYILVLSHDDQSRDFLPLWYLIFFL